MAKISKKSGAGRTRPGTLGRGSSGPAVETLQEVLNEWGYSLDVDGLFGGHTEAVVRHFQSIAGLGVDGLVGPATRAALAGSTVSKSRVSSYDYDVWYIVLEEEPEYVVYEYEFDHAGDDDDDDAKASDDEDEDEEDEEDEEEEEEGDDEADEEEEEEAEEEDEEEEADDDADDDSGGDEGGGGDDDE